MSTLWGDVADERKAGRPGTPLAGYVVTRMESKAALDIVVARHYLHRAAPCEHAFGLFLGDSVRGVCIYGTPSSAPLRSGIAGPEYARDMIELTRLCVDDSVPRNGESFLIGATLGWIDKDIVVSFADTAAGHVGTVYQATNWLYTGLSAKRTDWTVEGVSKHGQTLADKHDAASIREAYGDRFSIQERSRKHRYIYLRGTKRRIRELRAALRYPVVPYPKPIGPIASAT